MADNKNNLSIPNNTPIADKDGRLTNAWLIWFNNLYKRVGSSTAMNNSELGDSTNNNTNSINGLSTRVQANEDDIAYVNDEITSINATTDNLQNSINTTNNNVSNLQNSVNTNSNDITSLKSQVNTNTTNISNNTSKITNILNSFLNSISNIGTGIGLYSNKIDNTANFKSLKAGTNVTLDNTTDPDTIIINAANGGGGGGGGGGGLTYFSDSTTVNGGTINSLLAIGGDGTISVAIVPKGNGGFSLAIPDGTTTGGDPRGQFSNDFQIKRTNSNQVASGDYSVICGGYGNKVTGTFSVVLSGFFNSINNGGQYSVICGGGNNTITGDYSIICGGQYNKADSQHSVAMGKNADTKGIIGSFAHSSGNFSGSSNPGEAQELRLQLIGKLSSNTSSVLTSNNLNASTNNQFTIKDNEIKNIKGTVLISETSNVSNCIKYNVDVTYYKYSGTITIMADETYSPSNAGTALANGYSLNINIDSSNNALSFVISKNSGPEIAALAVLTSTEMTPN